MSKAKTKDLQRIDIAIDKLEPNALNPNEMSEPQFNMLCDNIEKVGITDPILVRPHPEKKGMYRIVGGHHRWEAAKVMEYEVVPCTVITDPDFDGDAEAFQTVRHNIIHGKMSPTKFAKLVESLSEKYSEQVMSEMFGFVEEEEFQKLIKQTAKGLPKEMQANFKEAAKELKTVDQLAKLLNSMFAKHGDTLPYGYMIIQYGDKDSVWLRMQKSGLSDMIALGAICREQGRALDHVVGGMLQLIANGDLPDTLAALLAAAPQVEIKDDLAQLPTLDFID